MADLNGKLDQVKGDAKEALGNVTDNDSLYAFRPGIDKPSVGAATAVFKAGGGV